MDFTVAADERYELIARTVRRFGYARLKLADKAGVLRFLERVSGLHTATVKLTRHTILIVRMHHAGVGLAEYFQCFCNLRPYPYMLAAERSLIRRWVPLASAAHWRNASAISAPLA